MKKTLAQKAAEKGLKVETVRRRMKNGWTEKKALNTPLQTNKSHPRTKEDLNPSKFDKYDDWSDGFIIMIAVTVLAMVSFGLIWMLTK